MQLSDSLKRLFMRVSFLLIVGGVLLWIATDQIVGVVKWSLPSWETILRNPTASYDQRMMFKWGTDSRLMAFVRNNTPSGACLITPPWVVPWTNQGNFLLLAYFLYPRKIYYGKGEVIKELETNKVITHVLVAWGRGTPTDRRVFGWPKFPVLVMDFIHFHTQREVFLADLYISYSSSDISSETSDRNLILSLPFLEKYLSDSQRKIIDHQILEFDLPLEYLSLTYTRNNYDYWTELVNLPLADKVSIRARLRANIKHSVNLIAEVRYANGKSAIFGSLPNQTHNSWEALSINDIYQRAKRYGLARDWPREGMEVSRIGINPGLPLEMPYLERYGVIELERGQKREREFETRVASAFTFLGQGHFHRAKNKIKEAIYSYQLAEILNPEDAWVHFYLGEMYWKQGEPIRTIEEYKKAIELEPSIAWFYLALSEFYRGQGKADLALKSLKRATEIDPLKGLYSEEFLLGE